MSFSQLILIKMIENLRFFFDFQYFNDKTAFSQSNFLAFLVSLYYNLCGNVLKTQIFAI